MYLSERGHLLRSVAATCPLEIPPVGRLFGAATVAVSLIRCLHGGKVRVEMNGAVRAALDIGISLLCIIVSCHNLTFLLPNLF